MADTRITEALKRARQQNEETRQEMAQRLLDYYGGIFDGDSSALAGSYLQAALKARYTKKWDKMYPFRSYVALVKPIVDKLALVFKNGVTFTVAYDPDGTATDKLVSLLPSDADLVLKTADAYRVLLRTVLIRPNYHTDGSLTWDIITPNVLTVVQNEEDPTRADAVIIQQNYKDTVADTKTLYKIWTPEVYWVENEDGAVVQGPDENPYGELPFVVIRDRLALDRFFIDLPEDLVNAQETANVLKTAIQYLAAYSMPTAILKNWGSKTDPVIGPSEVLAFDTMTNAEIGLEYAAPPLQMAEVRAELEAHIKETFRAWGLNPPRDTGQVSSGIALKLENYDALEQRETAVGIWRPVLRDLIRLTLKVIETHTNASTGIDPDKVLIDFGEISFPVDRQTQVTTWQQEIELGVKAPSDVLMEDNPDLTKEQAQQKLAENLAERNNVKSRFLMSAIQNAPAPGVSDE